MSGWCDWARAELDGIEKEHRSRATIAFDGAGIAGKASGRDVVSFASNDYLGLTTHPQVRSAAAAALERWGSGSGASRLVTGTRSLHHELEATIAQWKQTQRAVLFASGYMANLGVIQVFGTADTTLFSDALNHASIIDGCRLAKARTVVYRHNDLAHLQELLDATPGRKIVVTEAIFSMDGDAAPLAGLVAMCAASGALLIVDEAHAVLGPAMPEGFDGVLRVGTLSKAFGSVGGWIVGSAPLIQLLVNRARTFIYTTAPTPADTAAALASLAIYRSEEGAGLRRRLRTLIDLIRPGHASAIVPVILGSESAALAAARGLFDLGLYVPAIRPPTVARGTSRLRIALSAAHSDAMVVRLRDGLAQLRNGSDR